MFEEEILSKLREMHRSGMSYDEIANATGVARSAIGFYISGANPIKNPSINLLMKVFPDCQIYLNPKDKMCSVKAKEAIEDFRTKIIMQMLSLDMPDKYIMMAIKAIKNI